MAWFAVSVLATFLIGSASADATPIIDGRTDIQLHDLDDTLRAALPSNGAVILLAGRLSSSHMVLVLDLDALVCKRNGRPGHLLSSEEAVRATDLARMAMDQPVPYSLGRITADAIHRVALRKGKRVVLVAPPGPLIEGAAADLVTLCLTATQESP